MLTALQPSKTAKVAIQPQRSISLLTIIIKKSNPRRRTSTHTTKAVAVLQTCIATFNSRIKMHHHPISRKKGTRISATIVLAQSNNPLINSSNKLARNHIIRLIKRLVGSSAWPKLAEGSTATKNVGSRVIQEDPSAKRTITPI